MQRCGVTEEDTRNRVRWGQVMRRGYREHLKEVLKTETPFMWFRIIWLLCHYVMSLLLFIIIQLSSVFFMVCVIGRHLSSSALQHGAPWFWQSYHINVAMLTLASKLKKEDGGKTGRASGASDSTHRISIRDRLLTKGTWVPALCPFNILKFRPPFF